MSLEYIRKRLDRIRFIMSKAALTRETIERIILELTIYEVQLKKRLATEKDIRVREEIMKRLKHIEELKELIVKEIIVSGIGERRARRKSMYEEFTEWLMSRV